MIMEIIYKGSYPNENKGLGLEKKFQNKYTEVLLFGLLKIIFNC